MKRICNNGVAGFFEDLPSFIVILIALGVFISSLFYSSADYIRAAESIEEHESCRELLRGLRNYDKLLVTGSYSMKPVNGLYSLEKLNQMNTTTMKTDLRSKYEYNVSIADLANSSLGWSFGDEVPSDRINKLTMFTTTAIEIRDNEVHTARLKVTVW